MVEATTKISLNQIIGDLDADHPMKGVVEQVFKHKTFLKGARRDVPGLPDTAADLASRVCEFKQIPFVREDWDSLVKELNWVQVGSAALEAARQNRTRTSCMRVYGNAGFGSPAGDLAPPVTEDDSDVEIPDLETVLGALKGEPEDVAIARGILAGDALVRQSCLIVGMQFSDPSAAVVMQGRASQIASQTQEYDAQRWEAAVADLVWADLAHALAQQVLTKQEERYQSIFELVVEDSDVLSAANDRGIAAELRAKWIEAVARRRAEEIHDAQESSSEIGRQFNLPAWREIVGKFDWASLGGEIVDEAPPAVDGVPELPQHLAPAPSEEGGRGGRTALIALCALAAAAILWKLRGQRK